MSLQKNKKLPKVDKASLQIRHQNERNANAAHILFSTQKILSSHKLLKMIILAEVVIPNQS